jgi:hypothetical protein|tara:strand:+ start:157 stop:381 length:225 start_codon:yes stop_codon:yes gene_type:complete
MDITVAKAATEQALSTIDGALENKPTGLSRLLLAYSPELVLEFLNKGRIRLIHLRHREELLENTFNLIKKKKMN